jgi:acetylornithine aminotransferase
MAAPASSSTTRKIYESLSFLASTWPKDKLRPDVQFGGSILKAAERSLFAHTPTSAPPPQTSGSNGISTRIDSKAIEYATLNAEEESVAQSAIAALNSIKSGQASKKVSPFESSLSMS